MLATFLMRLNTTCGDGVVRAIVRDSAEPAISAPLFSIARPSVYNRLADFYTGGDRALARRTAP